MRFSKTIPIIYLIVATHVICLPFDTAEVHSAQTVEIESAVLVEAENSVELTRQHGVIASLKGILDNVVIYCTEVSDSSFFNILDPNSKRELSKRQNNSCVTNCGTGNINGNGTGDQIGNNNSGGGSSNTDRNIALGVGIGVGLPGAIAGCISIYKCVAG